VQNRCFAKTLWDREVREYCRKKDITYQGFSLLTANTVALKSTELQDVARRLDRTVPQVVFRFALEVGMIPLTGTTDPKHMEQDLAALYFELPEKDISLIERVAAA
jgi:diketogulonate reductase-like aldo/keto reductase